MWSVYTAFIVSLPLGDTCLHTISGGLLRSIGKVSAPIPSLGFTGLLIRIHVELPAEAQWRLANHYDNALNFSDGFIYRHLRQTESMGLDQEHRDWLAKLSKVKQRDYRQLCRAPNLLLRDAFDDLLAFVGLWSTFYLGTFHHILNLKSNPVSYPLKAYGS